MDSYQIGYEGIYLLSYLCIISQNTTARLYISDLEVKPSPSFALDDAHTYYDKIVRSKRRALERNNKEMYIYIYILIYRYEIELLTSGAI